MLLYIFLSLLVLKSIFVSFLESFTSIKENHYSAPGLCITETSCSHMFSACNLACRSIILYDPRHH